MDFSESGSAGTIQPDHGPQAAVSSAVLPNRVWMLAQDGLYDGVLLLPLQRFVLADLSRPTEIVAAVIHERLAQEDGLLEVLTPGGALWCDYKTTLSALTAALNEALGR